MPFSHGFSEAHKNKTGSSKNNTEEKVSFSEKILKNKKEKSLVLDERERERERDFKIFTLCTKK